MANSRWWVVAASLICLPCIPGAFPCLQETAHTCSKCGLRLAIYFGLGSIHFGHISAGCSAGRLEVQICVRRRLTHSSKSTWSTPTISCFWWWCTPAIAAFTDFPDCLIQQEEPP